MWRTILIAVLSSWNMFVIGFAVIAVGVSVAPVGSLRCSMVASFEIETSKPGVADLVDVARLQKDDLAGVDVVADDDVVAEERAAAAVDRPNDGWPRAFTSIDMAFACAPFMTQ
jgi:hypothetical protein